MDIVYIIGKQKSDANNFELRCSLRSIAEYGQNIDNVFIVGHIPEFVSDEVVQIPFEQPWSGDNTYEKSCNIAASVLKACEDPRIGDHFLVSMDDHFYTDYTDFNNYPIHLRKYDWGIGKNRILLPYEHTNDMPEYTLFLADCGKLLRDRDMPHYNFVLHRNMHIWKDVVDNNKEDLTTLVNEPGPLEIFAYIGNAALKEGKIQLSDCKTVTDKKLIKGVIDWWKTNHEYGVFSTPNFEKGSGLHILLKRRYPDKCKYEK